MSSTKRLSVAAGLVSLVFGGSALAAVVCVVPPGAGTFSIGGAGLQGVPSSGPLSLKFDWTGDADCPGGVHGVGFLAANASCAATKWDATGTVGGVSVTYDGASIGANPVAVLTGGGGGGTFVGEFASTGASALNGCAGAGIKNGKFGGVLEVVP